MNTYKTAEAAAIIGIHPNTVRLYEQLDLIPKPQRLPNGYRVFTDFHIWQLKLARTAFQIEILQNGLRKKIVEVVKASARKDFTAALLLTEEYMGQLHKEKEHAEEAIKTVEAILSGSFNDTGRLLIRKEVSKLLSISMDSLRNWELNGLLSIKRRQNGYRVYSEKDLQRLIIIRSLKCANYSLEAILRLVNELEKNPGADIKRALDTPGPDQDIISVCDKLISSLLAAEKNARTIASMLEEMKILFP